MIGTRTKGRIADINVTPMADVIIVLLIIFMVTIPTISEGPVRRLPEAAHTRAQDDKPLEVSLTVDSTIFVGGSKVSNVRELTTVLRLALAGGRSPLVRVRADEGLPYAEVARVLDACRAAGAEEIAFIARPPLGT